MTQVESMSRGELIVVNADKVVMVRSGIQVASNRGAVTIHFRNDHTVEVGGSFQSVVDKLLQHN